MNIALLLKSELRRSAGILVGMALIIALALSIAVAAGICERMVKASAAQSADDFDLLIGARGSSSALLLGTVFLRDEMLPIVPASAWANIREAQTAKSSIRWAAPVAFGDRTPSGRTIVGTTRSFLDRGKSREPAAGRFFTKPTEAVAGASSGYVIGDKFSPMHGRVHGAGHAHEGMAYEVVGILPPTGTPWDHAVMVPIESVWAAHADAHDDHDHDHDHDNEHAHDHDHENEHDHDHDHDHEYNAHVWVSVSGNIDQVKNIASQLETLNPENKDLYEANTNTYISKLENLKAEMHSELDNLPNRDIITFHEAFPYFAQEFNLNIVGVIEIEPDSEPSAKEIENIISTIKEHNIKALFTEPQYSSRVAQTIANETGASVYELDPIVTGDSNSNAYDDYINKMKENLNVLKEALK